MPIRVRSHPKFVGIYQLNLPGSGLRLATRNFTPGINVYGEKLVLYKKVEYRVWDAFRSKLAAAIINGINFVPVNPDQLVLYLGAASGTTPSHISDIVGIKGHVYCVEFASRSVRDLINNVCVHRFNMTPFVEDARFPEKYAIFIPGKVDVVYCDVAQPEQARILADNADMILKKKGWILLAVKAPSIDVTKDPKSIYKHEAKILKKRGFKLKEIINLEPYDKAHAMILGQK
ncbi:MAG: fibrillarin-like rRNA/tRNA 2'-O-methyltransferase [Candidatus Bathyarchaeota archaeon]|nr:fibrillarin-like rRNA/tRNA 2'-O-methyltransferase [Candidatus Bathyarchaeota archaeon]